MGHGVSRIGRDRAAERLARLLRPIELNLIAEQVGSRANAFKLVSTGMPGVKVDRDAVSGAGVGDVDPFPLSVAPHRAVEFEVPHDWVGRHGGDEVFLANGAADDLLQRKQFAPRRQHLPAPTVLLRDERNVGVLPVMHEQRAAQIRRQFHAEHCLRRVDFALSGRRVERCQHRGRFALEIIAEPLPKIEHESHPKGGTPTADVSAG